jgi:hypothetical protein
LSEETAAAAATATSIPSSKGGASSSLVAANEEATREPQDPELSQRFYELTDQALPFEIVRARRMPI